MSLDKHVPKSKSKGFRDIRLNASPEDLGMLEAALAAIRGRAADAAPADREKTILARLADALNAAVSPVHVPDADNPFRLEGFELEEMRRIPKTDHARYLRYRYKYKVYPRERIVEDYPPCVQIEPSAACNYRCIMCYQTDKSFTDPSAGHMSMMSLELFKSAVDQLHGRCEAVTLASRGEPLMNPRIKEMLAHAAGRFLGLKVNTNAFFLDEALSHALLSADVSTLVFSADAADEELYEKIRVRGKFKRIVENITLFREIQAKHYPRSRTITRVSGVKLNDDQKIEDMSKHWGRLVDQVAFVNYQPWETSYSNPANDIVEPCTDLWRRMFLWSDGRVNPCDYDYKSTLCVGNANERPLLDIWNGEKYEALRRDHLEKRRSKRSPCHQCVII